jgi:hypothetical protein
MEEYYVVGGSFIARSVVLFFSPYSSFFILFLPVGVYFAEGYQGILVFLLYFCGEMYVVLFLVGWLLVGCYPADGVTKKGFIGEFNITFKCDFNWR